MVATLANGMIRIEAMDAAKRNTRVIMENTVGQTSRSETPSEQLPFEAKKIMIQEDSFLRVLFKADANATITKADSTLNIPVTQFIAAGGRGSAVSQPSEIMLTNNELMGADLGSPTSIVCAAGKQVEIGLYKVPAGTVIMPGQGEYAALNTAKGRLYIKPMIASA